MIYIAGSIADMQSRFVFFGENFKKKNEELKKIEVYRVLGDCNFRKVCE